jgi:HlyD family secretion protein
MSGHVQRHLKLVLVPLLSACTAGESALPVVGTIERERIELIAEANEPIVKIAVREGQRVAAGQVLLRLDANRHQAMLAQARAEVERSRQRLAELVRGPRDELITEARAELQGMQAELVTQQREYARVKSLVTLNASSLSALDRARAQRDTALAARNQGKARLTAMLEGTTMEELDQARASLAGAKAAVRASKISLKRLTVRAPHDGIIDALPYYLGESPPVGAPVVVLLAGAPYARVYIPAPLRPHVQPGTGAEIRVEGMRETFPGKVRFLAAEAAFTPYFALTERDRSRLTYLAEIDLVGSEGQKLPAGQPVAVDFPGLHRSEH